MLRGSGRFGSSFWGRPAPHTRRKPVPVESLNESRYRRATLYRQAESLLEAALVVRGPRGALTPGETEQYARCLDALRELGAVTE